MMGDMIEFRNVSKSFWNGLTWKPILNNASFTVEPGRSLGILGENGAGKSTIINMIAGLEKPDHGDIQIDARVSWPVGFSGGLAKHLTGVENVRYVAKLYGVDADEVLAFVADFADIGEYIYAPVGTYSSGMRGRLSFGLLLAMDFDYYLVDEGTAAGDRKFRSKARKAFEQKAKTSTLIMVSHEPSTIKRFCSRAGVLMNGDLILCDSLEEARELYDYGDE